jgi:hypothetical protein
MAPTAAYDQIADWYEQEFLAGTTAPGADRLGIDAASQFRCRLRSDCPVLRTGGLANGQSVRGR